MSGHPPFGAQVILNGHEYVASQARRAGVEFTKQENCFTSVSNATGLAKIADTLTEKETAGRLRQLCDRWIYGSEQESNGTPYFIGFRRNADPNSAVG
jgi:hypothetical protein